MSGKPFDSASKQLVEKYPLDWLRILGLPLGRAEIIATDLSTVTTDADRVLKVSAPKPYLAQIELQASWDETLLDRLLRYNVLLRGKYNLPVESVIVLLRSDAERKRAYQGDYSLLDSLGDPGIVFRYRVLRVWEESPQTFLRAGLGGLPLAPLAKVTKRGIPAVLTQIEAELTAADTDKEQAALVRVITGVLMGLRFKPDFIESVLEKSSVMEESSYYQYILGKGRTVGRTEGLLAGRTEGLVVGRAEGERKLLLKQGITKFGTPDDAIVALLNSITNLDRLETLAVRLLTANSWAELLAQ